MQNMDVQLKLQQYPGLSDVKVRALVDVKAMADTVADAKANKMSSTYIEIPINSFTVVTDDDGQIIFLSNEGA